MSTAADHPTADPSSQVHGSTPANPPADPKPPARRTRGTQPPAKRTPSGAVEATKVTPNEVAKKVAPQKAVTNPTPAKKAAVKKASPAKKAAAAKAVPPNATPAPEPTAKQEPAARNAPAKKVAPPPQVPAKRVAPPPEAPAKKVAAAKEASPLKHALKAAAAEVAPGVVEPDMTTVPDEQTSGIEQPAPTAQDPGTESEPGSSEGASTAGSSAAATASAAADTLAPPSAGAVDAPSAEAPERTEAWARLIADPGHSPELLALAAVQTLGPQAQEWAVRMREAYPNASPDGIARLASQQFVRFGTVSSVFAAVAGSYAPLTLLGAAGLAHAELSLHVAAAYGWDPADPARAVDLLLLTRVHPTREDAEAALAAAREHSPDSAGLTDAAWRLGRMVAVHAGGWTVLRVINRFLPGASLLTAVLTSRAAARTVAARANLFYRTANAR